MSHGTIRNGSGSVGLSIPSRRWISLKYGSSVFLILLAGALFPAIGKWIFRFWFGLACAIGFCVSNLILLICFYGVMTPLALIRRMLGSQPLPLKEQKDSGWIEHEREMDPAGYFRQF